jgi:hypothetical protein
MRKKRNNKKKIHTGHGGQSQQMEKDKRKQTESEGSAAADVGAEDQEEPPVADGEGTRRRTRRKGSDEDDNGEALGPRKRWRATTGEEKKSKYSAREDEALLASVQAFCSVRHNHNHNHFFFVFFCFVLFFFLFVFVVGVNSVDAVALARLQAAGLGSTEEAVYRFIENKEWKNHRGCWIEIGNNNVPWPACGRAWAGIIRLRACMTRHIGCWLVACAMWPAARALPDRSLASVFERAKRTLNKKDKKGPWDEAEEQLLLEYAPHPRVVLRA